MQVAVVVVVVEIHFLHSTTPESIKKKQTRKGELRLRNSNACKEETVRCVEKVKRAWRGLDNWWWLIGLGEEARWPDSTLQPRVVVCLVFFRGLLCYCCSGLCWATLQCSRHARWNGRDVKWIHLSWLLGWFIGLFGCWERNFNFWSLFFN